ncbi:hypothetical protein ACHAQJ_005688 [Trichoderma viride]
MKVTCSSQAVAAVKAHLYLTEEPLDDLCNTTERSSVPLDFRAWVEATNEVAELVDGQYRLEAVQQVLHIGSANTLPDHVRMNKHEIKLADCEGQIPPFTSLTTTLDHAEYSHGVQSDHRPRCGLGEPTPDRRKRTVNNKPSLCKDLEPAFRDIHSSATAEEIAKMAIELERDIPEFALSLPDELSHLSELIDSEVLALVGRISRIPEIGQYDRALFATLERIPGQAIEKWMVEEDGDMCSSSEDSEASWWSRDQSYNEDLAIDGDIDAEIDSQM